MLSFGKAAPGTMATPLKRGAIATRGDFGAGADLSGVYSPSTGKPAAPMVMAEGSRYEHLRLTAGALSYSVRTHPSSEKLMQQQTLTKSASEVMVRFSSSRLAKPPYSKSVSPCSSAARR